MVENNCDFLNKYANQNENYATNSVAKFFKRPKAQIVSFSSSSSFQFILGCIYLTFLFVRY